MLFDLDFDSIELSFEAISERVHLFFFVVNIDQMLFAVDLQFWMELMLFQMLNPFSIQLQYFQSIILQILILQLQLITWMDLPTDDISFW